MPYGKKLNQKQFETRFRSRYGNLYDLSQAIYLSARKKLRIGCATHGHFAATPDELFQTDRLDACPHCSRTKRLEKLRKKNCEEFFAKARAKYGDAFSFEDAVYTDSQSPIKITCKEHGSFLRAPVRFLRGITCPKCGENRRNNSRRLSLEQVLDRLKETHWAALSFKIDNYLNNRQTIEVACEVHGKFISTVGNLLSGKGCKKCGDISSGKKRTLSTKQWIEQAKQLHGNTYDYSLTTYEGAHNKVTLLCQKHGEFQIRASNHIHKKQGCRRCAQPNASAKTKIATIRKARVSAEQFLKRFEEQHPDGLLSIQIEEYTNMHSKITVTCRLHGSFKALPSNLVRKTGCPKCASEIAGDKRRISQTTFVKRCQKAHGNIYNYDLVDYTTMAQKVTIVCPIHGAWEAIAANHVQGKSGCPVCDRTKTKDRFASINRISKSVFFARCEAIHSGKYDYSQADFTGVTEKILVICKEHGAFKQLANSHLSGKGCPKCGILTRAIKATSTREDLLKHFRSVHGDRYDYLLPERIKFTDKAEIVCEEHGLFRQLVKSHFEGKGCPKCSLSKGETAVALFLERCGLEFEVEFAVTSTAKGNPMRFDFHIPSLKTLIEFDGHHHFQPVNFGGTSDEKAEHNFKLVKQRDKRKTEWAQVNGFRLIRIKYDENVEQRLLKEFSQ